MRKKRIALCDANEKYIFLLEEYFRGIDYLPFVADELVQEGKAKVKVLKTPDKWYGVTYKEDKPDVVASISALVEEGKYPDDIEFLSEVVKDISFRNAEKYFGVK